MNIIFVTFSLAPLNFPSVLCNCVTFTWFATVAPCLVAVNAIAKFILASSC